MDPWWERLDERLEDELAALAERNMRFTVDNDERAAGRIVLHGATTAGRLGVVGISIVYPGTFPHTRPVIYQTSGERLGRHQHPLAGNYCLIGRSSDYWWPSMTAADLLDGLPGLVAAVDEGGQALRDAEDPQGEPVTTYYTTLPIGCILVPAWVDDVPAHVTGGTLTAQFNHPAPFLLGPLRQERANIGQGLLLLLTDNDGTVLGRADPALAARFTGPEWTGRWVRIGGQMPLDDASGFADHIADLEPSVREPGSTRDGRWSYALHAALFIEEIRQGQYGQTLLFLGRASKRLPKPKRWEHRAVLVRGERFTRETMGERIPHLRGVRDVTVTVVGLGTLGAPLAHLLAQAQTGRLRLADYDTVEPGTAVRWPAGLPAAGVDKSTYLAAEIRQHHPFVDIIDSRITIGQTSPPGAPTGDNDLQQLTKLIDGADLVIDATAEDNVSRAIADVASHFGVPQLHLWGVDGYGGVVALCRPGHTGCLHCLSLALGEDGSITPPPAAADLHSTRVQPRGCSDPTFVAAAPDLLPLVNQAVRVALATLTAANENGYGTIDDDVFVLALRAPDGTPLPVPSWRSYRLPPTGDCWYCHR